MGAVWLAERADGSLFTGLISAAPFQLDDTEALVVVVRDISQLKATKDMNVPPSRR